MLVNVLCLKHGTKYSYSDVNKLFNMTKRNLTVPFRFVCMTEDPLGLDPDITVIPLPAYNIQGWWFKLWSFSSELPLSGTTLFMDLDIVIINNINELFDYEPNQFCIIQDFIRSTNPTWDRFNSSVFRFDHGKYNYLWDNFVKDLNQVNKYHGDQDYIYDQLNDTHAFFPKEWIVSYKWEVRNRKDLFRVGDLIKFKESSNPQIDPCTKVLVFHGNPKPSDVADPIIIDNWY